MKVSFNRRPPHGPWGGGASFVENMSKFLYEKGHDVVFDLSNDIDLIFMIDPRPNSESYSVQDIFNYKNYFPNTKIFHRVNECDKRKNTNFIDNLILQSSKITDVTVFISSWLESYFFDKGFNKKSHVVYNGCNNNFFFDKERNSAHTPIKLVTHHWSDNWMKGFDIYSEIDKYVSERDDLEFTYIGRYCKEYTPVNTNIILPISGADLASELRNHDIYVTASRWEPCGMHHIEGSACGLPVLYHQDGGGINELCKNHGEEFNNFNTFLDKLDIIKNNYSEYANKIDHNFLSSSRCCDEYYAIIKDLMRI